MVGGTEVPIIFITSCCGLRSNNRERTQPCPSTENWIKDLLSMAHSLEQDLVSPTVSLSHQEAFITHLSLYIREDRMKTAITES